MSPGLWSSATLELGIKSARKEIAENECFGAERDDVAIVSASYIKSTAMRVRSVGGPAPPFTQMKANSIFPAELKRKWRRDVADRNFLIRDRNIVKHSITKW